MKRLQSLVYYANMALESSYGALVECGVFKGKSINALAKAFPSETVYGYDSFEGLPEDWERSEGNTYKKGHFNLRGNLPKVHDNVVLIPGFFKDSLSHYKEKVDKRIALLHVDCDLYSSSYEVLSILNDYITPGTILALDEFRPVSTHAKKTYKNWEEHQYKAVEDWRKAFGRRLLLIDEGPDYEAKVEVVR